ncbi:MAG: AMP-binding protein, partial [Desulfomonilia bacterium]|nr:AMP-binding protein [Desulfomonilia bacterium]
MRKAFGEEIQFVSGGAALDPEVQKGFQELGFKIFQGYGITETAPVISAESPFAARCGTVGLPLEGVEIRIDHPNADGVGEIVVRGPNVMLGYYRNPQATAEVLQDGWYRTGDLGSLSADGYLTICGRVKNLIVTPNGKNVYPEEIENELIKSPYIAEAMVYGHKVGAHAEEVHAMIFPDQEGLDAYTSETKGGLTTLREVEELIR